MVPIYSLDSVSYVFFLMKAIAHRFMSLYILIAFPVNVPFSSFLFPVDCTEIPQYSNIF